MFRKHQLPSDEPLRDLPLVEAPDSIWISLENALDAGEKPRGRHGFRFPIWQPALVVASLVVVAGVYWRSLRGTEPQGRGQTPDPSPGPGRYRPSAVQYQHKPTSWRQSIRGHQPDGVWRRRRTLPYSPSLSRTE